MLRRILSRQRPVLGSSASSILPAGTVPWQAQSCNNNFNNHHPMICGSAALLDAYDLYNPTNHPLQVRWKRRDGNKSFLEPRKPTRKQKKVFRKRQQEVYFEKVGKHSPPNSKASVRRQHDEEFRQDLLSWNPNLPVQDPTYDIGDALLDDLMGNTASLTSTPTPEPIYLGDKYSFYFNTVAHQMKRYKEAIAQMDAESDQAAAVLDVSQLPSDHVISMVVRSYRDKHGTRLKPVGVAKVLSHLLKDLELPISAFGEETFTSVLTCCATPKEARRIFKLMKELQHPICSYSWSILVDIHAKLGDFQGCDEVMREMVMEGVAPSLPTYTSLLAACYKVSNSGHIPPKVRAEAGKLGWSKWKEMRIVGVEPDVMAYGAMLRLCAARGHAEHALNLLDEMHVFGVKPTTLCFSSALKAIARSHQIAIRFENGSSTHYRKRQEVAAHHGKMTRQVVIKAENAEVELDDGFIANLILCAGAAGDSATAKAIVLASEVRKLDHLRTIGSTEHLSQLAGNTTPDENARAIDAQLSDLFLTESLDAAETMANEAMKTLTMSGTTSPPDNGDTYRKPQSFAEREYGKDSRVLSALMQACSQALDYRGLGSMWEGRDNKGYLCESSLLMLTVKPKPTYRDDSIPGITSTEVGISSLIFEEEDPDRMSKRLRRKKFDGITVDDSGTTLDDLDPDLYKMFEADDPALQPRTREQLPLDDPAWDLSDRQKQATSAQMTEIPIEPKEEWYFDINERKWMVRTPESVTGEFADKEVHVGYGDDDNRGQFVSGLDDELRTSDRLKVKSKRFVDDTATKINHERDHQEQITANETGEEWIFDQTERRWKTRPVVSETMKRVQPVLTEYEAASLSEDEQKVMISYGNSTTKYQDAVGLTVSQFLSLRLKDLQDRC